MQASGSASGASIASALRQGILLIPLLYLPGGLFQLEELAIAPSVADCIAVLFTGGSGAILLPQDHAPGKGRRGAVAQRFEGARIFYSTPSKISPSLIRMWGNAFSVISVSAL